jgi:hypothetical protein
MAKTQAELDATLRREQAKTHARWLRTPQGQAWAKAQTATGRREILERFDAERRHVSPLGGVGTWGGKPQK